MVGYKADVLFSWGFSSVQAGGVVQGYNCTSKTTNQLRLKHLEPITQNSTFQSRRDGNLKMCMGLLVLA